MSDTLSHSGDTASPSTVAASQPTAAVSPQPSPPSWNAAETVALLSLAAVSIAAFFWSAIALHGVAVMSGIDSRLAWGAPVIVDGPIVQAAFSLVALNRREKIGVVVPAATRRFFWAELAAAELVSLIGNGVHAWKADGLLLPAPAAAAVAGAAPIAALAVTHALTALMEVPRTPAPQATAPVARATTGDTTPKSGDTEATPVDVAATPAEMDATAARDAEILRLHQAGLSYREIAPIVGLHHGSVGKILARLKTEGDTHREQLALPAGSNVRLIAG
jgi:DNA-binding CsgD family transcriptional regulator